MFAYIRNWSTALREGSFVVRLAEFVEFAGLQGEFCLYTHAYI